MTAEFKRLGRRGAYRLGDLRYKAGQEPGGPAFRPRFTRPDRSAATSVWLLGLLAGSVVIIAGTALGLWFMPFAVGLLAGVANGVGRWPPRVAMPAVAATATAGWAIPLGWSVLRGAAYGPVAREIAAQVGLPGYAAVGMIAVVLVAVIQALVGYWLGRALAPRPASR
ncbi:MAG TPA: hypothetical protein VGI58_00240 [Streptosporangiaceae bacterium]